jgi:glycosyltransferase involved in cell wall biosynthesis
LSRKLLAVGHSFIFRSNRRLAEAIQSASNGAWEVTVAAPTYYQGNPRFGDLKPESLAIEAGEAVNVVGVPMAFTNRIHVALYGKRLKELMSSGFDAIHCWEEPFILSGGQMARWAPPDAMLTYFSFQNIQKTYPPPFGWLERKVMERADGWVAAATLVEQALEGRPGYRDKPHRLIGVGTDPNRFKPDEAARSSVRASLDWSGDDVPVVGYLGRFTEAKGIPIMMRVLERVDRPWRALFVGSGALEKELRAWGARFGERVKVITGVGHERVPDYLNAMDVLVAPSQTTPIWREQFGRMLIEAFACRLAVIASDSGEIPYVVADAGVIVPEKDEAAYQSAIEELVVNDAKRELLARKGFDRVHQHYTWDAIGEKYVEFFDSLETVKRAQMTRATARELLAAR